mmetsp:Transcript_22074/g.32170  ORF Transcript_22074/g.32170 Transcript_22074/m.32170 type:complete len:143 (-) Transcript_22074:198-626(-)
MIARSIRDIVAKKSVHIEHIVLSGSPDLICKNMMCEKLLGPCICRLEHALASLDLTKVKSLDLSKNKLNSLPPSVEAMANLTSLNISANEFVTLPRSLLGLEQLSSLDISNNNLPNQESFTQPLSSEDIRKNLHLFQQVVSN